MNNRYLTTAFGVLAGVVLGASGMSFTTAGGQELSQLAFSCHMPAQQCTLVLASGANGEASPQRQIRFKFNGTMEDEQRHVLTGSVPEALTDCVAAFKQGTFGQAASLLP